jgi:hypothetical protein
MRQRWTCRRTIARTGRRWLGGAVRPRGTRRAPGNCRVESELTGQPCAGIDGRRAPKSRWRGGRAGPAGPSAAQAGAVLGDPGGCRDQALPLPFAGLAASAPAPQGPGAEADRRLDRRRSAALGCLAGRPDAWRVAPDGPARRFAAAGGAAEHQPVWLTSERVLVAQDQAAQPEAQGSSRGGPQRREHAPISARSRQREIRRYDDGSDHGGDQPRARIRRWAGATTRTCGFRCRIAKPMTSAVRPSATLARAKAGDACATPSSGGPATTAQAVRPHGSRLWCGRTGAERIVTMCPCRPRAWRRRSQDETA